MFKLTVALKFIMKIVHICVFKQSAALKMYHEIAHICVFKQSAALTLIMEIERICVFKQTAALTFIMEIKSGDMCYCCMHACARVCVHCVCVHARMCVGLHVRNPACNHVHACVHVLNDLILLHLVCLVMVISGQMFQCMTKNRCTFSMGRIKHYDFT